MRALLESTHTVSPSSLRVKRLMPPPCCSATSKFPAVSNAMPRGVRSPVARTLVLYPAPIFGIFRDVTPAHSPATWTTKTPQRATKLRSPFILAPNRPVRSKLEASKRELFGYFILAFITRLPGTRSRVKPGARGMEQKGGTMRIFYEPPPPCPRGWNVRLVTSCLAGPSSNAITLSSCRRLWSIWEKRGTGTYGTERGFHWLICKSHDLPI